MSATGTEAEETDDARIEEWTLTGRRSLESLGSWGMFSELLRLGELLFRKSSPRS